MTKALTILCLAWAQEAWREKETRNINKPLGEVLLLRGLEKWSNCWKGDQEKNGRKNIILWLHSIRDNDLLEENIDDTGNT